MSQTADALSALYEATSERTLVAWQKAPDCGEIMQQAYYDPHKLALASGIQPPFPLPSPRCASSCDTGER
jgi:hypothetical protein